MRIISGKYKSRRIPVPNNLKARPTTDFARESLFNVLNNMIDWEETTVLDLFSGTGSVALEFVSRGCPFVISVESNQNHYNFICKAQEILGAKELFPIKADVFKYLQSVNQKFDLIFADPPYDLPAGEKVPSIILEKNLLKDGGIFIMEHSKNHDFSHLPLFKKERKYGNVHFSFFEKEYTSNDLKTI
ncbi:MAG: 16S rRNA (guanine(966)-N(2))-methyltransferase RsmD [Bacteroidia bacterium]|nr:16S rRNA (guanine(966)-N(2))-methyltransferase RsmD [Bacteroidia bacterium]